MIQKDRRGMGTSKGWSRHQGTAIVLALVAAGMVGMAYAAVPLYRIFCQVTGYGGTTQRAEQSSERILDQTITVRFDATVSPKLQWSFAPARRTMTVRIGENALAFFKAVNRSDHTITGTASYNVTPEIAGSYFNKIECFCFTEQRLAPGQSADMPVSFFVDPAIMDDPDARDIKEITLSYTFFKSKDEEPSRGAGQAAGHTAAGEREGA